MLLALLFVTSCLAMGRPQFSRSQLAALNTCKDEGVDPGYPLLLTPYVNSGQFTQAKQAAKVSPHK
jgi:hypothetical protein